MRRQDAQQAIRALGKVLRDQVHLPRALKAAEQHLEALSLYISSPEHAKAPAARCSTSTTAPATSAPQAEREERTAGRLHIATPPPAAPAAQAPPVAAPALQAQWQEALRPVIARLTAIEAAVASPNCFAALAVEEASDSDERANPPGGSYAAAVARTAPRAAPPHRQPAAAPPRAAAPAQQSHRAEAVILRNAANNTPERLVSLVQLPAGSTTSRMRSGDALVVVRSAQEAAALRCTASSAGLSVATPVGRHGVVVHYVPRVEGALEDVVRAVEARAGEGEGVGVVRGRPRWLGGRSAALGSVLVLLWDPVLAEALCSGDGELMVACMRARCERARPGRARGEQASRPDFAKSRAEPALASDALSLSGSPRTSRRDNQHRISSSTPPSTPSRTTAPAPAPSPSTDFRGASAFLDNLLPSRTASPAPRTASSPSPSPARSGCDSEEAAAAAESDEVGEGVEGESWADEVDRSFAESTPTPHARDAHSDVEDEVEVEVSREGEEEEEGAAREQEEGDGQLLALDTSADTSADPLDFLGSSSPQ